MAKQQKTTSKYTKSLIFFKISKVIKFYSKEGQSLDAKILIPSLHLFASSPEAVQIHESDIEKWNESGSESDNEQLEQQTTPAVIYYDFYILLYILWL